MTVGILDNFRRSLPELDLNQGVKMILSSWLFPSIGDEEGESRLFPTWAKKNGSLGRCPRIGVVATTTLTNIAFQWEDSMQRGLFRYDVTACETKVIPGQFGFIAQLNEGRHLKKRPTEFRVDKVLQPFDGSKFNFTKVEQDEVMF